MKKIIWPVLLLLVFCACTDSTREIERGMAMRSRLLSSGGCNFDVQITADYGDKIHTFSLTCQGNADGDLNFQVTAPKSISGIRGKIAEDGGKLTFDDTAVYFPLIADNQISPITAPWILWRTIRSGYLTSACIEDGFLRLTLDDSFDEDALMVDIWLDEDDSPVRAEMLYDGRRILSLKVENFRIL